MRVKMIACVGAALAMAALAGTAEAQSRRRPLVAVMDFDYGTVNNWWGQYDIGKGMADQVVDALVNDGTFRVVERKKLDTVLAEQDFAHSDRADPSAAKLARIGKVLGVKYIIAGSITKFSTEKRGGGLRVHGIGLGGSRAKSEVALTARVIDATTGEIMLSAKGLGQSSKGGGERVAQQRDRRRSGEGLQRVRESAGREGGPTRVAFPGTALESEGPLRAGPSFEAFNQHG
jgi:curli biogenesis system outer membrane secretion channel CsgG